MSRTTVTKTNQKEGVNIPSHWLTLDDAAKEFYCDRRRIKNICRQYLQSKNQAYFTAYGRLWVDPAALREYFTSHKRTDAQYPELQLWIRSNRDKASYIPMDELRIELRKIVPGVTDDVIKRALSAESVLRMSLESKEVRRKRHDYVVGWLKRRPGILFNDDGTPAEWRIIWDIYRRYDRYSHDGGIHERPEDAHPAYARAESITQSTFRFYVAEARREIDEEMHPGRHKQGAALEVTEAIDD